MQISVAIAAYNAADYLREAIDSVLAQTFEPAEVVVVDDGSTDHTHSVCESFGDRVRYIYRENDQTAGFGARYRSIEECKSDWIALMDHDDRWLPTKLERQVEAVKAHPDAGVVFTRYRTIDDEGSEIGLDPLPESTGGFVRREPHDALHHLLLSNPYCPSSALVHREALERAGEPDFNGCGDWAKWLTITREFPMVVVDEHLTEYRVTSAQFCSNKDHLATRMRVTLGQQQDRLIPGCGECERAFREGEAHIAQIFEVAARDYLDQYHENALAGNVSHALPFLWMALKKSPREVLSPRRAMAVTKNYAIGKLRGRKGSDE